MGRPRKAKSYTEINSDVTSSRTYAYTEKEQWVEKHLPFIGKYNIVFTHQKDKIYGDLLFDDSQHFNFSTDKLSP